jgi:glycosyltransferase involved in cell wall biosynthesis
MHMDQHNLVSVIVPTFKRPEALRQTVGALMELEYPADRYEVIVVDDGADEETRAVVERPGAGLPRVSYVPQDHAGVATARNRGAAEARGDLLIFIDDDIVVARDHLQRHLEDQVRFGDALVNGHWEFSPGLKAELEQTAFGRFRMEVEAWVKDGINKEPLSDDVLRPAHVTACNLGIRAQTFVRLGGFDEDFPYAGCEDQDFSLRAAAAGLPFVYDRAIGLEHNDRRLSLPEFGERQRRGAMTHVLLAARHPAVREESMMLVENGPLRRGEPFRRSVKKLIKSAFARPAGFAVLDFTARVLEVVAPNSGALRRIYWATLGVYIYAGIRDGLQSEPKATREQLTEPAW